MQAFVHLLQSHDMDEIPLKLLLDEAGVCRVTFYYHFDGFDDVALQLMEESVATFWRGFEGFVSGGTHRDASSTAPDDPWFEMIAYVWDNRESFRAILGSTLRERFANERIEAHVSILESWSQPGFDHSPEEVYWLVSRFFDISASGEYVMGR